VVPLSSNTVLANWAALMALWALPYLTLLHHFQLEASQALQWSLLVVGICGTGGVLFMAWKDSCDPAWRAAHGLLRRPAAPALHSRTR
jgi:hypothetical protein